MNNSINFVQPAKRLCNYIANYYLVELSGNQSTKELEQKPLSNGCVEMFIGYHNTKGTFYTNTGEKISSGSGLVGPHNLKNTIRAIALEHKPKTFKFVAINFKPEGFYKIFNISSSALYNGFYDVSDVLGLSINLLKEQLENAMNNIERKKYLDLFFIDQLNKRSTKHYNIKTGFEIARFIRYHRGNIRIGELMNEFKISERTLQRDIKMALGLSPKEYCKIIRFHGLFNFISKHNSIDWIDMVSIFGYYDQAHLINEFKGATGVTPELFIKNKHQNLFKVNNHLVLLNPIYTDNNNFYEAFTNGETSFLQSQKPELEDKFQIEL